MAITSIITNSFPNSPTTFKVTEQHTDSIRNIVKITSYTYENGTDADAKLAEHALVFLEDLKGIEIQGAIQDYMSGLDPLHNEPSPNNFVQIVPDYQTWDELATPTTVYFLESEDMQDLRFIETTIVRISASDKRRIWDTNNPTISDINGDIQISLTTQQTLDAYSPRAVDGVVG